MLYWDDKLVKELASKDLYEGKLAFIRTVACAEPTMTIVKLATNKIDIKNSKATLS